ncbi:MAG TPA: ABC transporter permease [Clostridiales bacterium]|nr:ABC transporter permease [Clostridiales bacterium]
MKKGINSFGDRLLQSEDVNVLILTITFVAVLVVLSIVLGGTFLSAANFQSMGFQIPEFGLLSLAMSLCMLAGGIDLSIVGNANLSSVLAAYTLLALSENGGNPIIAIIVAIVVGLVVGVGCGLLNGLLIAKVSILPILATLSTMILYDGIAMALTDGKTVLGFPLEFSKMAIAKAGGIPGVFIVFVVVAIIISLVLTRTFFGKNIYLYGANKTVSLFSGIRVNSLILKTYAISGLFAGIAGLMLMARVNSAKVGYGDTYLLQTMLVSILGGVSPTGGKGKVLGVFLGILVLQMLQSGFTLLGVEPYFRNFIWGVVLIGVMIANFYIERSKKKIKRPKATAKEAQQPVA